MAAGDLTPAVRVEKHASDLFEEREPGSYTTGRTSDGHIVLFLVLPNASIGTIRGGPDGWNIIEHEDGTHSASPSIWNQGEDEWHGYLEAGVFREV